RPAALARREAMVVPERLLITLGGIDLHNATGQVLDALAVSPRAIGLKITVVLGESAPHLAAVRTQARNMPMHTDVAVNVSDMADRMVLADLCIGAAGSTAWERCALGLPTLQVVLADNQISAASHMADDGLTIALPFTDAPGFSKALDSGLEVLGERTAYKNMAHAVAALTDGRGAALLARDLLERTSNDAH
ncbi:UDP-2,4-diacetamido-2,4,6-trideoxy-beta-L-altropyranose hydrolase, partial [Rhodobacteraceae bacterium R_SAG2]|nr:UDP-2,4-diacetamido-2,4,6-trideoxy-beta-L-altropyranose hydrolase [Rhodobacteraceae bacterium R_SAG2]